MNVKWVNRRKSSHTCRVCMLIAALAITTLSATFDRVDAMDVWRTEDAVSATPADMFADLDAAHPCQFGPPSVPLRLAEAVNRALCGSPKTREAWANVKVQSAAVGAANSAYLPTVTANLQDVRDNTATDVRGYPSLSSANRSTVYSGSVAANWVLYDFGGRKAAQTNARALLAAALANQNATLQTMFSNVATDYYAAQAAAGKLRSAGETERIARDSFIAASARVTHGVAAISDRLQTETSYAQATFNRVKAEGDLSSARGVLAADMNLRPDQPLTIPEIDDGVMPDEEFIASIGKMIDEAQSTHPAIAAARAKLDAAVANEQQTRAEGLPTLSLVAKISQNNQPASLGLGEPQFAANGRDWYVGVQVQIPLFDGFSRTYKVRGAHAQVELQRDTLDEARQQVALDVWRSYQSLQTNTKNARTTAALKNIAQRSFDVAKHRYAAGVGSILELLSAQKALSEAQQQGVQALADWHAARIQLAAKMGQLSLDDLRSEQTR